MKINRGIIALFATLGFAGSAAAQTEPVNYQGSADYQVQEESPLGNFAGQTSAASYKIRQDDDATSNSEDEKILDEAAISEQLKQLKKENDEIRGMLEGMADGKNALTEFGESFEEQNEWIEDINSSLGDLVSNGHGNQSMNLFGRIHLDHWGFPEVENSLFPLEGGDPQDRIVFRRMRIGVQGEVRDNMFYKIAMEFAGGNNPSYRDAYIGWNHLPLFNEVKIGNQKRPYGLDHWNSSRYNVFIERPLVIEAFSEDNRRLGISSWGHTEDLRYHWQYGLYNHLLTQDGPGYINDHYQAELASRFSVTPWYDECSGGRGYIHLGMSGSIAFPNGRGANNAAQYRTRPEARTTNRWYDTGQIAGANKSTLVGFEGVYNNGPFQMVAEYQYRTVDRTGFVNSVQLHGGYVYASYFLTGEHIPWNRKTGQLGRIKPFENFWRVCDCDGYTQSGMGAWQVAARLSHLDLTDEAIIGGDGSALTLGLNWYWNAYARMQFNYIIGDVKRDPIGSGDYQIIGTRFMIDF